MAAEEEKRPYASMLESYRRRYGRPPWEEQNEGGDCCIGLTEPRDDSNLNLSGNIDSSRESRKADATPAGRDPEGPAEEVGGRDDAGPVAAEKLERGETVGATATIDGDRCRGSHGESRNRGQGAVTTLPRGNAPEVLEQGPCGHPVAALLASRMDLDQVELVECAAGCGHRLYSDRGPLECPCHWPAAKAAGAGKALCGRTKP